MMKIGYERKNRLVQLFQSAILQLAILRQDVSVVIRKAFSQITC